MDATRLDPEAGRHDLAPDWLRWLGAIGWRILVSLALGAFLVAIAVALSTTTVSVIVSILVAAAISPYIQNMRARGWSRSKAAAAGTVGAVGVIVGALVLIALAVVPYIVQVLQAVQDAIVRLQVAMNNSALPPEIATIVGQIATDLQTWLSAQTSAHHQCRRDARDDRRAVTVHAVLPASGRRQGLGLAPPARQRVAPGDARGGRA